ncbi:MAG TPA: hypothetical protein VKY53_11140 [Marinobacter sp.]|nr:hypothetical protein [Marinobacter sp.]
MFQLVFKGECVPGTDLATARGNAKALFKASVEQLDRMFSGHPVVIRNKLEQEQAGKYQAVLRKHGMIVYVQPMARPAPAATPGQARQAPAAPVAKTDSPAPAGGVPAPEPGDRLPVAGDKVDEILAGSGLTLDPPGVILVEPREVEPPMFQHIEDWTLAPPGSDLGVRRPSVPEAVPDVSHLSLADDAGHKD